MDLGLRDKFCLVTAASRGLGRSAAEALAVEGATIMICSRTKRDIERTAKEIRKHSGADVIPLVADVSRAVDLKRIERCVEREFGTLHVLVSNAGGPPRGDLLTMKESEWKRGVELTLMSTVRLVRAYLPRMITQGWGRVITITSVAAKQPIDDLLLSTVLRPGIHALSKVISNQHAASNITINTVCPGYILTERQRDITKRRAVASGIPVEEMMRGMTSGIPAGRMGRPDEIGSVIAFLASERASYINGVNILVDGGMTRGVY